VEYISERADLQPGEKYSPAMRTVHWLRAAIILGMIWAGWTMVSLDNQVPAKFDLFYPYHKSFGILAFLLVLTQLTFRSRGRVPGRSPSVSPVEHRVASLVQWAMYLLMILVPLLGYARSSTDTQSDGVFFFGINLPELLPKNDDASAVLQTLHRICAYSLLALIVLHVLGALKHRLFDRAKGPDPLSRML